ncbi:MAG: universal stress protein [Gemmatimonadota bacterium]|jgi:nucleotide-binding universal stress UspA family protein
MMEDATRDGSDTLLVGVSNPDTAHRLVELAGLTTRERPWEILLTHVVTVADQISLTTGQSSPEVVRARDFLQETKARASEAGVECRALVEVARSVEDGLLAAAESRRASMILVGFSEKEAPSAEMEAEEGRFDRTMHKVARKADADVVVAKFRKDGMDRVLVPVAAKAHLQVAGFLCRVLGALERTTLTFLHVVEPGAPEEEARQRVAARLREKGIASFGKLVVITSEDPLDAIVHEAASHDLMIIGPSGRPGFIQTIFSSKAERLAEEAPASVLLVWNRKD